MRSLLQLLFTSGLIFAASSASSVEAECLNGGIISSDNSTCDCAIGFTGGRCELALEIELSPTIDETSDLMDAVASDDELETSEAVTNAKKCDKGKEENLINVLLVFLAVLPNMLIPFSCAFAWFLSTRECCQRFMTHKRTPVGTHVV